MKTSIATVSISGSLPEKLAAIAAAGFDGIEIFEQDFLADANSPRTIGQMVRDQGLEITLFQPFRDFEGLPEPLRSRAFDRAERKFDLMQELGAPLVLICSSVHPATLGGIDRAADDLRALGERAAARGLKLGYEALAWGRFVNDHRDAWEVVRRADHPSVGLILDSFHTLGRKLSPDSLRAIPGDRIFFVQLADAPAIDMDLLYWSRHFRNMPGEGDLDVTGFLRAVLATGYSGPLSLEIFNDQFRGGAPLTVAQDGYRALVALLDDVWRAEPGLAPAHKLLPARQTPTAVSFIEFASQGDDATALAELFASLGFERTGAHVSKQLSLWQQGDCRLLINSQPGEHAGESFAARGRTVCDIGLTVADAKAVVARAVATGAASVEQPRLPGELAIPAIAGLGGSLLHFLDAHHRDVWQREFGVRGTAPAGVGLTHIDHIAQTMSYDQMLSWSLFYSALFAVEKAPMIDVVDPDGLVRSQALVSREGGFSVTLNGAENQRTLAGSLLAGSSGAGVQHIAFACADIFAVAARLAACGFPVLELSDNYYADLASRFDLPEAALAALRAANILYDADAAGQFFQLYSRPQKSGLFFEIVERRGGYRGFGGPNAPFRIAAQKRALAAVRR